MHSRRITRTDFANLVLAWKPGQKFGRDLFGSMPDSPPYGEMLWLCWADENDGGSELPRLVIVADDGLADFLAWATTYLPTYRPLTSFFRVLPWSIYAATHNQKMSLPENKRSVDRKSTRLNSSH